MEKIKTLETLNILEHAYLGNADLFRNNLEVFLSGRPKVKMTLFLSSSGHNLYWPEGEGYQLDDIGELTKVERQLRAYNSAIITNCFSLFEACFENSLLCGLEPETETGCKRLAALYSLDKIIKISGLASYSKKYKFVYELEIEEAMGEKEKTAYEMISKMYVLRHLLAHGSASKTVVVGSRNVGDTGKLQLDSGDFEYQDMLKFLREKLNLDISMKDFHLETLLLSTDIVDAVVKATDIMCIWLTKDKESSIKIL